MRDRFVKLWSLLGETAGARTALVVVLCFAALALCAPLIAPHPPNDGLDLIALKNMPPSTDHLFGTDPGSRDVFSRVLVGSRVSLGIAAVAVTIATTLGTIVGLLAGLYGGWVDRLSMRLVDAAMSVPRVLLVVAVIAFWNSSSIVALMLLLGCTGWFSLARLVRSEVRTLASRDFVTAARAVGVSPIRRATHHLAPHLIPLLIAHATLSVASVIAVEAALSYLGLGVRPPTPSWGNIMYEGRGQVGQYWWLTVFPALATLSTVAAVHTLGDGLRTAFSSRQLGPVDSAQTVS
jgi:peptide/nickel transport system permease protein